MKRLTLIMFVFLFAVYSNLLFAQNGDIGRHTRIHQLIVLNENESLEYTWIQDYQKENNEMKFSNLSVLIDLNKYGKWVFKRNLKKIDSSVYEVNKSFENLDTKEVLFISYISPTNGEPDQYTFYSPSSDKKIILRKEEIAKEPKNFHLFLLNNFTKKYVEALEKLREIVFKIYNEAISFEITPYDFMEIWGRSKEAEFKKSLTQFPALLHPNCSFDAQFGYPCSPEEVPGKNPKVLVIEKKR